MSFNLILFKFMVFFGLSFSLAAVITPDNDASEVNVSDLQTSATSAKLLNLGSLLGLGNTGYYPNNNYRPGCISCYGSNSVGCYCPGLGRYPSNNYYPNRYNNYYPNNNFYPNNYYPTTVMGTNILGGGYGGYGGYGGNGGFRQYSGYYDPYYTGRRNLGYAYYTNTNNYGLPRDKK